MAERQVAQLGPGAACCSWNHCGRRLAAGAVDGSVSVYDSQPSPSSKWQAHEHAIVNVVWLPPEYGDAIARVCADGTLSLCEEIAEGIDLRDQVNRVLGTIDNDLERGAIVGWLDRVLIK